MGTVSPTIFTNFCKIHSSQNFVGHLVNTASLGHTFFFADATGTSVFPLIMAAKAAVINFYEMLRFELRDNAGITIATHGLVGSEMTRGMFMLEEGSEMQWKEEREDSQTGGFVEEFARLIVSGACRGNSYVKFPSWYDIFLLYRLFAPSVLGWVFLLLFSSQGTWRKSLVGTGRPLIEATPPRKPLPPQHP